MATDLRRDWARVQQRLDPHDPISQLPAELLGYVFQSLNSQEVRTIFSAGYTRHPPTIVSHVCSRWREVALKTPSLWGDILVWSTYNGLQQLQMWLVRAGVVPLTIRLISRDNGELVEHFAEAITAYLGRLRKLQIDSRTSHFMGLIMALAQASNPSRTYILEDVRLSLAWLTDEPPIVIPAHNGAFFGALRRMRLDHVHWEGWEACPVQDLRVQVRRGWTSGWRGVLAPMWNGLHNLRRLEILVTTELDPYTDSHRLNLPQLSELKIRINDQHLEGIFSGLDAPKLATVDLEILREDTSDVEHYTFLSDFSTRCSPILKLTVTQSYTLESSIRINEMIRLTPSIEDLTISGIARDKFYSRDPLASFADTLSYLPDLKTLRLEKGCFHYDSLNDIVRNGLQHRVDLHLDSGTLFLPGIREEDCEHTQNVLKKAFRRYVDLQTYGLQAETTESASTFEWD